MEKTGRLSIFSSSTYSSGNARKRSAKIVFCHLNTEIKHLNYIFLWQQMSTHWMTDHFPVRQCKDDFSHLQ